MKISVKGRYALAASVCLARRYESGDTLTVSTIAADLGISKIYLEQVFSILKKSGILFSSKGSQGGYRLSNAPEKINAYQILSLIELSLMDRPEATVGENAPDIEDAMQSAVFQPLDKAIKEALEQVSVADLTLEADRNGEQSQFMFSI